MLYIVTLNLAWRGNIVKYILFSVSSFSGVVYPVMTVEGSQLCEPATVGRPSGQTVEDSQLCESTIERPGGTTSRAASASDQIPTMENSAGPVGGNSTARDPAWDNFQPNVIGISPDSLTTQTREEQRRKSVELFGCELIPTPKPKPKHKAKGGDEHYPVFTWEEETLDEMIVNTGTTSQDKTQAYSHSMTQIPGEEGVIPDTGSVFSLSGGDAVDRHARHAEAHGHKVVWEPLSKTKHVSGVGDNTKTCTHVANIPTMLEDGTLMNYRTPVVNGHPSPIPSLYGLDDMAAHNTYFGTANGLMAMIPEGTDKQIHWPPGTRFIQCKRAPSRHWIMTTSNWHMQQSRNYHTTPNPTVPYPSSPAPPGLDSHNL